MPIPVMNYVESYGTRFQAKEVLAPLALLQGEELHAEVVRIFGLEPVADEDLLAENAKDQACSHVVIDIIVETADRTMKK